MTPAAAAILEGMPDPRDLRRVSAGGETLVFAGSLLLFLTASLPDRAQMRRDLRLSIWLVIIGANSAGYRMNNLRCARHSSRDLANDK
jgi:hypothetical protein